jgi:Chromosome segregation protein Csm1/Pcs1
MYSDLTGLMIRGIKRGEDEDVYDCIQTGRNGSELDPLPILQLPQKLTYKLYSTTLPSLRLASSSRNHNARRQLVI